MKKETSLQRQQQRPQLNTHFEPFPHDHPPASGPWAAHTREDGSEAHRFRFALPKGTLDFRMSGIELAEFVLKHIAAVIGMRLLDFTDYVCPKCGCVSRLAPEAHVCPKCNFAMATICRNDIHLEFTKVFRRFLDSPHEKLDELLTWVKPVKGTDENDYIEIDLSCKVPQPTGPTYFV